MAPLRQTKWKSQRAVFLPPVAKIYHPLLLQQRNIRDLQEQLTQLR